MVSWTIETNCFYLNEFKWHPIGEYTYTVWPVKIKSKCARWIFDFHGNLHEHNFLRQSEISFNGLAQEGGKWTLVTTKGIAASNSGSLLPALRRINTIINGYFHDNSSLNVFSIAWFSFYTLEFRINLAKLTVPQRLNNVLPSSLLISDGLLTFDCDIQIHVTSVLKIPPCLITEGPHNLCV